jgi:REP element-mobilizing transposase RayT
MRIQKLNQEIIERLYEITEKYPTLFIQAVNVDEDHLHLQIEIPPSISVAKVVQTIKTNLSTYLQKKFKFIFCNCYI